MADKTLLADDVRRAVDGDTWYGPSLAALLGDVTAEEAAAHVPGEAHSIAELVAHTASWAGYLAYRLRGGAPGQPSDGDWPATGTGEDAWRAMLERLKASYDDVLRALDAADEAALDAVGPETPRDENGEPVTLARAVAGIAQHAAYHAGQIAVLKRAVRGAR